MKAKKQLTVGCSPLSNRIYAGSLAQDGCSWLSDQTDVTTMALVAVCQHVDRDKDPVIVTCDGKPLYEIEIRRLDQLDPDQKGSQIADLTHENAAIEALAIALATALEEAGAALFDAGLYGADTPFDRTRLALDHPLLDKLRNGQTASVAAVRTQTAVHP